MTETPHYNPTDRLTELEFAEAVGCSRPTLIKLRHQGIIPYCRVGRNIFYLGRHIEEFFLALEHNKLPKSLRLKLNATTNATT